MPCAIYLAAFVVFASAVTAVAGNCAAFNFTMCERLPACSWCPSTMHADVGVCYNYTDGSRCCAAENMSVACSRSEKCCGAESHNATCCGANSTCCGGQCCGPNEACDPSNKCQPDTFDCPSVNHVYVVKCKTNLETCCGYGTMGPTCLPVNGPKRCCTYNIASGVCFSNETCCGGGGPGASSSVFCCKPATSCCWASGRNGYGTCCPEGLSCCRGDSYSSCCSEAERCYSGTCQLIQK